jgi:hypothetical protein
VVTPGFNRNFEKTITTITHPTDFPDPPIIVTETFTETITIDPVTLPVQLASSTTAPIGYQEFLQLYSFSSNVGLSFPDTITVSGTYKVEGPTETITRTFSIPFQRTGSGAFNAIWIGFVRVGANYPETGRMGAINYSFYPVYTPTSATIFEGTVDGFSLTARFSGASTRVTLPMPVPETVSVLPWLVCLTTLLSFLQRSNRGRVS